MPGRHMPHFYPTEVPTEESMLYYQRPDTAKTLYEHRNSKINYPNPRYNAYNTDNRDLFSYDPKRPINGNYFGKTMPIPYTSDFCACPPSYTNNKQKPAIKPTCYFPRTVTMYGVGPY